MWSCRISTFSGTSSTVPGKYRVKSTRIPPKNTPKSSPNGEQYSNQPEHGKQKIADVVALADGCRFIPRDFGFVVHGVQQLVASLLPEAPLSQPGSVRFCVPPVRWSRLGATGTLATVRAAICGVGYSSSISVTGPSAVV